MVALGTLFVLGLVLLHEHMRRRDIDHLSRSPPQDATARRSCWHASHCSTCWRVTSSGVDDHCKVDPGCPGCPPAFFSLCLRKLLGLRTKRSDEGGRWLLWLSDACRSCKDFICSLRRVICSCICLTCSSRCVSTSCRTRFPSRRWMSSSSVVIPLLYWV